MKLTQNKRKLEVWMMVGALLLLFVGIPGITVRVYGSTIVYYAPVTWP